MTTLLDVLTPAASLQLTTLARARSDLNLSVAMYADAFVNQMIDSASAAIVAYLNIVSDGAVSPTLALETIEETFRDFCGQALALSRAPISNVASVQEESNVVSRLQSGADGVVDIVADPTAFASMLGPAAAGFLSSHVGAAIVISGAGAGGAAHSTTIASVVDGQNITLTAAALTSVTGAAYTVENPAFGYEWRRGSGLLYKTSGGFRTRWAASLVRVVYDAGYVMPSAVSGRNLPLDIEDACILLVRRKIDQLRESENPRLKSEAITGIGSWTFDIASVTWEGGLPSDVRAILDRYKRRVI